jgi:hypothetical protein
VNVKWLLGALCALLPVVAGCKQGIGERCQLDGDCASGICSKSDPKVCQGNGSGTDTTQIDALLPFDAAPPPPVTDASSDDAADAAP